MECTQEMQCTQELYETYTERVCPEQIGFLGICGEKHPVVKGPNNIGRDKKTCKIVVKADTVSRLHAMINVLNGKECTLMDVGSRFKTKLLNNPLKPFISYPLRNGDTVQFGNALGIFRLLEEDDELPLTQDIYTPDILLQTTEVPQSRDVSADDSFLTASPTNTKRTSLSSGDPKEPLDETLSKQSASSSRTLTNNNYLSRRSNSLSFIDNPVSGNSDKNVTDNIHDMVTQPPNPNESNDSTSTAQTEVSAARPISPSVLSDSLNTHTPSADNLPGIRKIDNQRNMQFDLYAANKIPKNDDGYCYSTQDLLDVLGETSSDILLTNNGDKPELEKTNNPAPKLDVSKKLEVETLPERLLTRQRKPTDKLSMRVSKNIAGVKDDVKETSSRSKDSKIKKNQPKETKSKNKSSVRKGDEKKIKQKDDISITEATTSRQRSRKEKETETKEKAAQNKSVSLENNKKEAENKRTRNKRKEKSKSPENETRRSKRNQTTKEKSLDGAMKVPKPILKHTRQSTDYYMMKSPSDEPNLRLKRTSVENWVVTSPKRTRSYSSGTSNASLRATPGRNKTYHVVFTSFFSEEAKSKLEKLGAVIVTDVLQCSVVLTMRISHTFKLLCALGLGKPIVGPAWVQACVDTNIIVDPWLYLLKDEYAEKRLQFNLRRTLTGKRNFLKGYNVSSTLSVQPNATEMKLIVECSGGSWSEGGANWVCVSCTKDKALWPALRRRGARVVSTEFILGGVLKQKLDLVTHAFP